MSDSSYIDTADSSYTEATSSSYIQTADSSPSEIDSLPSSPTTSTLQNLSSDEEGGEEEEEEGESDAEREWKESLQQLELLLTMVLVPYVGKYFGRKCAYWGESNRFYMFCLVGRRVNGFWGLLVLMLGSE